MSRRSGLGKGLDALIPSDLASTDEATDGSELLELSISQIEPNQYQPRGHFDEEAILSLSESIRELGVLQPILVRPAGPGRYELIAGERRWRASQRAGLLSIPAIVRTIDDGESLAQAVVENLHRQDLNPLEEAAAYQQLLEDFGLTQDQVATRVGKSRSAVANTLRLFQLPASLQALVADGQLSAGHARTLLGTPDRQAQERLARQVLEERLTVRELEAAVRLLDQPDVAVEPSTSANDAEDDIETGSIANRPLPSAGLLELERLLGDHLDTSVSIKLGGKRGRISIDFADLADLERIYYQLERGLSTAQPQGYPQ